MSIIPLNLIFQFESALREFGQKCVVLERPFAIGLETDSFRATRKMLKIIRVLLRFAKRIFVFDALCSTSHYLALHLLGENGRRVEFHIDHRTLAGSSDVDVAIYTFPKGGRFSEHSEIVESCEKFLQITYKKALLIRLEVNYL